MQLRVEGLVLDDPLATMAERREGGVCWRREEKHRQKRRFGQLGVCFGQTATRQLQRAGPLKAGPAASAPTACAGCLGFLGRRVCGGVVGSSSE